MFFCFPSNKICFIPPKYFWYKNNVYSLNLCHSAICLLGDEITSFQWCNAVPVHFSPPKSNLPITCKYKSLRKYVIRLTMNGKTIKFRISILLNFTSFFVTLSQSSNMNSKLMFFNPSSRWGNSNTNDSLKTGFNVRFLTWVFFFAIRWSLYNK